ncbi:hypothetical protein [Sphingosinicella sp. BN140058]|uniref:hypothetical protein n=1 Tax=Sphingosinicella sp. BN140058 TaxID=1892855 RepID=UPI00101088B2|nr:hypothetical protein [Sphingosinicella sp. BN140058]QAY78271.1 hypothetical protein ETR14_18320 [Sphingosinicella sp. BN140058]
MIFIFWWTATLVLMLVNLGYLARKVREDHREGRRAWRFVGVLALIGAGSWLLFLLWFGFHALMSV